MGYPDNPFLKPSEEFDMYGFDPLPFVYDVEATFEKAFVLTPETVGKFKEIVGEIDFTVTDDIGTLKETEISRLKEQ